MNKAKLLILILLISSTKAFAESYDNQLWLNVTLQGPLSTDSKLGASIELQPRYSDKRQETFETLLRPALYYKADDLGTFHLGYLSRSNSDNKEIEKRYWTQWSKSYGVESYKLFSRVRYEIRDLNLSDKSQRVRLMGRVLKDDLVLFYGFKPLAVVELFYNMNDVDSSIKSGFKQSRNSVGISRKFENMTTTEFLFTKNYIDSATAEDQDNNVLQIILTKEF